MRIGGLIPTILPLVVAFLLVPTMAHAQAGCVYESEAAGGLVVPPTDSQARSFLGSGFDGRGSCSPAITLEFGVVYYDLESEPTGAHIRHGEAGENGDVVFTLFDGYFPSGATVDLDLDAAACLDIFDGKLYYVVETAAYPEGAVRGQIVDRCWSPTAVVSWGHMKTLYR
jgi:hypothetical protein